MKIKLTAHGYDIDTTIPVITSLAAPAPPSAPGEVPIAWYEALRQVCVYDLVAQLWVPVSTTGQLPFAPGVPLASPANTIDISPVDGESWGGFEFHYRLALNANTTGHTRVPILLTNGLAPANQESAGDGVTLGMGCLALGLDPIGSSATTIEGTAYMPVSQSGANRQFYSTSLSAGVPIRPVGHDKNTTRAISMFRIWLIDGSTLAQQGSGCFLAGSTITCNSLGLGI